MSIDPRAGHDTDDLAAGAARGTRRQPSYSGRTLVLLRMALANALFETVTLGLYRFWSRARLRRYIYARLSLQGYPLGYVGRGGRQFLRALAALLALLPFAFLAVALDMIYGARFGAGPLGFALLGLVALLFCRIALFRARRYRLAQTVWRGRALVLGGSALRFALLEFWWLLLTVLSLGLAYPAYRVRRQSYLLSHTSYGGRPLEFFGRASQIFPYWLLAWLLLPWTLGLSFIWYRAREFRYFLSRTRYGPLDFRCALSSTAVLAPFLLYVLVLVVLSGVGLAAAYAIVPDLLRGGAAAESVVPGLTQAVLLAVVAVGLTALQSALIVPLFRHPVLRLVVENFLIIGQDDIDRLPDTAGLPTAPASKPAAAPQPAPPLETTDSGGQDGGPEAGASLVAAGGQRRDL